MTREKDKFEDMEFHQAKVKIAERFTKVLTDLQKTVAKNGFAVQAVQRFRSCLEPTGPHDVAWLPIFSASRVSRTPQKINCVLSLISHTVMQCWWFYDGKEGGNLVIDINEHLAELENYVTKGLKSFTVKKSEQPFGYYLEEIQ